MSKDELGNISLSRARTCFVSAAIDSLIYFLSSLIRKVYTVHIVRISPHSFHFRPDTSFDRLIVLITDETAAGVHSNWCTEWKYRTAAAWNARNSACLLFYSLLRSFLLTTLLWSLLSFPYSSSLCIFSSPSLLFFLFAAYSSLYEFVRVYHDKRCLPHFLNKTLNYGVREGNSVDIVHWTTHLRETISFEFSDQIRRR